MQGVSAEDARNPSVDWGLGWKQSLVAGRQRRGLSITDSLTGAGRLDYIKAFLGLHILFYNIFGQTLYWSHRVQRGRFGRPVPSSGQRRKLMARCVYSQARSYSIGCIFLRV
jgi:hypothetical protein